MFSEGWLNRRVYTFTCLSLTPHLTPEASIKTNGLWGPLPVFMELWAGLLASSRREVLFTGCYLFSPPLWHFLPPTPCADFSSHTLQFQSLTMAQVRNGWVGLISSRVCAIFKSPSPHLARGHLKSFTWRNARWVSLSLACSIVDTEFASFDMHHFPPEI